MFGAEPSIIFLSKKSGKQDSIPGKIYYRVAILWRYTIDEWLSEESGINYRAPLEIKETNW